MWSDRHPLPAALAATGQAAPHPLAPAGPSRPAHNTVRARAISFFSEGMREKAHGSFV